MRSYYLFLRYNFSHVFFGWLLTFFSSFGQTFFISLFVPGILTEFQFSKSVFGGYYALATVIASFFLLQFGHLVDNQPIRPFTVKTNLLLAASCALLGMAVHPAMVFLALIGLRLGGQGLMSHISMSVMSRHFTTDRGKALSLSALGYPMGEMVFPLAAGAILAFWDWRVALFLSAFLLFLILLSFRKLNLEVFDTAISSKRVSQRSKWRYFRQIASGKPFWILVLPVFMFGFVSTALFFYQYLMAEEKGWSIGWYSMCFTGYAISRLAFMLYGGILTDKFSARSLFPFYLIPVTIGLLALALIPGKIAPLIFLVLTGISSGANNVISTAVIAELYGTERVGQVRSLFSMILVFSTALAPVTLGFLLDHGTGFSQFSLVCAAVLILVIGSSFRIKRLIRDGVISSASS